MDGVLVPGGFGDRGIEGMISAIYWYARDNKVPYLRHLPGYADGRCRVRPPRRWVWPTPTPVSSSENGPNPVIDLMPDQKDITDKGGTMRLGAYPCKLTRTDTRSYEAYGRRKSSTSATATATSSTTLYREQLEAAGLILAGVSPERTAGGDRGSCPITPGSWAPSSTPSSRAAPTRPSPCSGSSSRPPSPITRVN